MGLHRLQINHADIKLGVKYLLNECPRRSKKKNLDTVHDGCKSAAFIKRTVKPLLRKQIMLAIKIDSKPQSFLMCILRFA